MFQVLRERLISRGTETNDSIEKRMSTAVSAIEFSKLLIFCSFVFCLSYRIGLCNFSGRWADFIVVENSVGQGKFSF